MKLCEAHKLPNGGRYDGALCQHSAKYKVTWKRRIPPDKHGTYNIFEIRGFPLTIIEADVCGVHARWPREVAARRDQRDLNSFVGNSTEVVVFNA